MAGSWLMFRSARSERWASWPDPRPRLAPCDRQSPGFPPGCLPTGERPARQSPAQHPPRGQTAAGRQGPAAAAAATFSRRASRIKVMKWLDPLAPDHLVLPGRASLDGMADNRRAFGRFQLEPVLALQLNRPDHPERARGAGAVGLLPNQYPRRGQTVSLPLGSRSDLRRPDAAEVGDKGSDPLWRRRDHPLVVVPDLHRTLTSPRALRPA